MKKNEILWNENGWTVIGNADGEAHTLEVSALAENGKIVEVRVRHADGEEKVLKAKIDAAHTLPMALADFKAAVARGELKLK